MAARAGRVIALGFMGLIVLSLVSGGAAPAQADWATSSSYRADPYAGERPSWRASRAALPAPDDPAYSAVSGDHRLQWPLYVLDSVAAWSLYPGAYFDASTRPEDTPIVAVIDTGIDPNHPDFENPGAGGADVSQGGQILLSAARGFGCPDATDEHGHGTHLAGIIAAAANNAEGIAGLGYPVRLLPLKVADESGLANQADLAAAIVYAADQGASVILIGFTGPAWSREVQEAVDYAWERGCFLVAPAGDAGDGPPMFPGACPHVFAVAPTTIDGAVAWYASAGDQVALCAPGGDEAAGVYSTLPTYACTLRPDPGGPPYGFAFGSAQAAAHVAAAAGLWLGSAPEAPAGAANRLLWRRLQQSAVPLDESQEGWRPDSGYGLLSPAALLAGDRPLETEPGGIVGRVLSAGAPVAGAAVTAVGEGGATYTAYTTGPAGAFRLAHLPPGTYTVSAATEDASGLWEGAVVQAGCDTPAVDFSLGGPPCDSEVMEAALPAAAVCGRDLLLTLRFRNTGEGDWTRREGHCLRYTGDDAAAPPAGLEYDLPPDTPVAPGGEHTFSIPWRAPERYGYYRLAFQMAQQGGVGRFGETAEQTVAVSSFLDVPPDYWAVSSIEAVKAAGVAQGYPDDCYLPGKTITRDQMAVFIARALAGGDQAVPTGPATASFPDVPRDHWAFKYVEYCHSEGVVQGYADGYHPEGVVNRGQMAVFIARAMAGGEESVPDEGCLEPVFPDVPCDFWARKYIQFIKAAGVTSGYPDGLYHPEITCTRDQMAVYISRAFGLE